MSWGQLESGKVGSPAGRTTKGRREQPTRGRMVANLGEVDGGVKVKTK